MAEGTRAKVQVVKGGRVKARVDDEGQGQEEGRQESMPHRGVSGLTGFGLGFALAAVMGAAGGPLARAFRPVLRTAVKGGIRTGRWLSEVAEQTREHFEDVVAEARHQMGEEGESHGHHHHDHGHVHSTRLLNKTES
ncbi:hypothetical protein [Archangium sp.]|uniref:hypothetical protein n=1 Tax=Archangium sp. TaxID=1872627 RepID=UPI002D4956ED|nr:hypothetical protein [Archangium sp.]HYO59519.1 hypothetical protein [Archangium sp.]